MRRFAIFLSLFLAAFAGAAVDPEPGRPTPAAATMPAEPTLYRGGGGQGPTFDANVIHLLSGAADESNALILPLAGAAVPESFAVRASVRLDAGGEGFGILLMDAAGTAPDANAPVLDAWEEPNRERSIGIGFDGRNPPASTVAGAPAAAPAPDNADADGNVYDRPQRECSVHVNGREILNRQSDADFATGEPVPIEAEVRFVPGGALLTVRIAGRAIYVDELLPGVVAFAPRVAIGARSGAAPRGTKLDVREVRLTPGPPLATAFAAPRHVTLFDKANVTAKNREPTASVDLGDVGRGAARVIATLRIDAPAGGMDKLDRRGALYCYAGGQRYELVRFRTPAGKPWQWAVDVTDFLPLLRGEGTKFGLFVDTWRNGYTMSVGFDFYPGASPRVPIAVVNLWQGEPILGDSSRPITDFFDTRSIAVPPGATGAHVRLSVTGHGRSPNTRNAAEFLQIGRTLWANGIPFTSALWKKDNYLNPCRPQTGPWRIDRAGWGPGSITEPWTIDVSDLLGTGGARTLKLDYALNENYVNDHVGRGDPPTNWADGQVIFYAPP